MKIEYHKLKTDRTIGVLQQQQEKITGVDNIMDFIGDLYGNDATGIVIPQNLLTEDFFDLKTGLAGDMLQKFSTYKLRLFIVGDFSAYTSKSLADFIRESNRQRTINFVSSIDEAFDLFVL